MGVVIAWHRQDEPQAPRTRARLWGGFVLLIAHQMQLWRQTQRRYIYQKAQTTSRTAKYPMKHRMHGIQTRTGAKKPGQGHWALDEWIHMTLPKILSALASMVMQLLSNYGHRELCLQGLDLGLRVARVPTKPGPTWYFFLKTRPVGFEASYQPTPQVSNWLQNPIRGFVF